jgi:hypothetical protein
MFDSKQTLTTQLADAVDLMIDFATLGEYGLEPVGTTPQACKGARQRPRPIADRNTFTEVLFPNRLRAPQLRLPRGPRPNEARKRGGRGASSASTADGAA